MKRSIPLVLMVILVSVLTQCKPKPSAIEYGFEGCQYCSMTIVDRQHAAELVTKKGKVFKFDAVECLIHYLKDVNQENIGLLLVNDYDQPGVLIDAFTATYLISDGIPSPMGAYLTAFSTREKAEMARSVNGGELYEWEAVKEHLK